MTWHTVQDEVILSEQVSPGLLRLPLKVAVPLMLGAVIGITLIVMAITYLQGKPVHLAVYAIAAATMFASGIASLVVTMSARKHKQYYVLSGLIGVTAIMVVPILVVVAAHVVVEKTMAHFVFSHIIVYYLMFLPVGVWLLLPPAMPKAPQDTENNQDDKS